MTHKKQFAWSVRLMTLVVATMMMFALLGSAVTAAGPGDGVTVKMGKASWTSAEPVVAVYKALLEDLGYNVKEPILFSSNPIAYLAISTGDVDFWPNGWFPIHWAQVPKNFDETSELVGNFCQSCGVQGYLVDTPSVKKFGIKDLSDFKRPEVKKAFDANGDGKADLFGCPPGWGCHETIEFHLDAYNMRDDVNHVTADYTADFANALARIQAGQPTLYYTWAPNDTILKLVPGEDVSWIGVPSVKLAPSQESLGKDAVIGKGVTGAVEDPLTMGWVASDIQVVANKKFLKANPAARALFQQVKLPLGWISEATAEISGGKDSKREIEAMAHEWLEANKAKVDQWLSAARAAAK